MYNTETIRIQNSAMTMIGHTRQLYDIYTPLGFSNAAISLRADKKLFTLYRPLKYILNTFPYNRSSISHSFNFELYEGIHQVTDPVYVLSYHPFIALMGQRLTTASTAALVYPSTKEIRTQTEVFSTGMSNIGLPVHFESRTYNKDMFFVMTNTLCTFTFNSKYETILHPFSISNMNGFYNEFELNNKEDINFNFRLDVSRFPLSIHKFPRPRFLFSGDGGVTWHKYSLVTSTFSPVTPSSTFFTVAEFRSVANPYTTYTQIPFEKFAGYFGTEAATHISVLAPSYLYPKLVSHSMWYDQIGNQEFLWGHMKTSKWTFLSGLL